jgi:hypothetical protein
VEHVVASLGKDSTDKQTPVAMSWIFLAAEQSYAEAFNACLKTCDSRLEAGVLAEAAVDNAAGGVVIGGVRRASAQLRAEEEVAESCLLNRPLNELSVKLRNVFGIR